MIRDWQIISLLWKKDWLLTYISSKTKITFIQRTHPEYSTVVINGCTLHKAFYLCLLEHVFILDSNNY